METNTIKQQLHTSIDLINDESQLNILNEVAQEYLTATKTQLTTQQQQRLQQSVAQAKTGQLISHESLNKKVAQWLTK